MVAKLELNFFSRALFQSAQVTVVLPTYDSDAAFAGEAQTYPAPGEKYETLWLLHGFTADHTDWCRFSGIERYAREKQIAVVMPGVDNSFYEDLPCGGQYYEYYTQELPRVLRAMLPLSDKREHNFVAGLSMGGYGALKAALREPGNYAAAASLSGGVATGRRDQSGQTNRPKGLQTDRWLSGAYGPENQCFDPHKSDLRTLLSDRVAEGAVLPALYLACGTEDFAYPDHVEFRNYVRSLGVELCCEEGPGVHNWQFWDPYIRRVLDWLPLAGQMVD